MKFITGSYPREKRKPVGRLGHDHCPELSNYRTLFSFRFLRVLFLLAAILYRYFSLSLSFSFRSFFFHPLFLVPSLASQSVEHTRPTCVFSRKLKSDTVYGGEQSRV